MNQRLVEDSSSFASVCVVIPTLGRSSLQRAAKSALSQTRKPNQMIIVNDGPAPLDLDVDEFGVDFRVVEGERRGASAARNQGVSEAVTDWIAFLDDDDAWRPDKLELQLEGQSYQEQVVLSCGARVHVGGSLRFRPHSWFPPDLDVLGAFFGTRRFGGSSFYLPTPSFVVPSRIARKVPFDETLSLREDIWWLHQLQVLGIRIVQFPEYLVEVYTSVRRNNQHNSEDSQLRWAAKLESWDPELAIHYLRGMATRDALIAARPMQAIRLLRAAEALARSTRGYT